MADDRIKIGLIGLGTIGEGVVDVIESKLSDRINIKKIAESDPKKKKLLKKNYEVTENAYDIINDKSIDILVELIGGYDPAKEYILEGIRNGKNIVTANKAVISEFGPEIFEEAKKYEVNVGFEASVGGGMQLISTIKKKLETNKITKIIGILNGTTNYILTKMNPGLDYNEALKEAQSRGFAEANPDFDVSGKDAAQKLSILSSIVFNQYINPREIYCEGITKITDFDISSANDSGYVIKLLAIAKKHKDKLELMVHPTLISKEHPLAKISYETNAVYLVGDFFKEELYTGKGAGKDPTASAVAYDILDIVKKIKNNTFEEINFHENPKDEIINIDKVKSRWNVKVMSEDVKGVLWRECKAFYDYGINIAGLVQLEKYKDNNFIPDVFITSEASYGTIKKVVKKLSDLSNTRKDVAFLRIED